MEPCTYLAWDSEFFGIPIARLNHRRLSPVHWPQVADWCRRHGIACLYFLADAGDRPTIRLAEAEGFRLVDVRVEMQCLLSETDPGQDAGPGHRLHIRSTEARDITALEEIAALAHQDSRFFFDEGFPPSLCRRLYALWIRKSCQGSAEQVFTALVEEKPVGYISLRRVPRETGRIDLVGVDPSHRGRGIGRALLAAALDWFDSKGVSKVKVGTQSRNLASQRLYQRCGFRVCEVGIWYHKWFKEPIRGEYP